MVKLNYKDFVFYFDDNHVESLLNNILITYESSGYISELNLMAYAQFVINKKTNQIIKCRYLIEDLIDAAVKELYD